jgi:hypothetical protein
MMNKETEYQAAIFMVASISMSEKLSVLGLGLEKRQIRQCVNVSHFSPTSFYYCSYIDLKLLY